MPESLAGVGTAEDVDAENRRMTLIVTPFPQTSWSRLIRMSVTIDPRRGSLFALIQALNRLHIFPRHIEDVTGTSFAKATATKAEESEAAAEEDPIVPSATLVLELPRLVDAGDETSPEVRDLHGLLHDIIVNPRSSAKAIPQLEEMLAQEMRKNQMDRKVSVQWISPMATLNKLSKRSLSLSVEKIRVSRSAKGDQLELNLQPWQRRLWPPSSFVPFDDSPDQRDWTLLAMASRDSDEKIIAWYFYRFADHLVVQFEMTIPALGLEHAWWEFIYECVWTARGTVLGSASSARIDGGWGILQCTAMFPLKHPSDKEAENFGSSGEFVGEKDF